MPKNPTSVRTQISTRAGIAAPSPAPASPADVGVGPPTVARASMPDAETPVEPQARGDTPPAHATLMPGYPHGRGGTGVVPMPTASSRPESPAAARERPAAQPMPHE